MNDYIFTDTDMKLLRQIHQQFENVVNQNESNELHGVIKQLTHQLEFTLDQIEA